MSGDPALNQSLVKFSVLSSAGLIPRLDLDSPPKLRALTRPQLPIEITQLALAYSDILQHTLPIGLRNTGCCCSPNMPKVRLLGCSALGYTLIAEHGPADAGRALLDAPNLCERGF